MTKIKNQRIIGPIALKGFQAILQPSKKFENYVLSLEVEDEDLIASLETEFEELMEELKPKLKNPKRAVPKPEPWVEVDGNPDVYKFKFSWKETKKPTVTDASGVPITNPKVPLYSDSIVKVAYHLGGYISPDGQSFGVKLYCDGIRIIQLPGAGPSLSTNEVNDLFGEEEEEGFTFDPAAFAAAGEEDDDNIPF